MMTDYIDVKAKEENCSMIVLDAFTGKFYCASFFITIKGMGPKASTL
jgi:hypothetical protein